MGFVLNTWTRHLLGDGLHICTKFGSQEFAALFAQEVLALVARAMRQNLGSFVLLGQIN
jgi:hypothetical protein